MTSPERWAELAKMKRATAAPLVEAIVRTHLAKCAGELTTTALVDELFPHASVRGLEGSQARSVLFGTLLYLHKYNYLADCSHKGPEQPGKGYTRGKMVRPLVWHKSNGNVVSAEERGKEHQERNLRQDVARIIQRAKDLLGEDEAYALFMDTLAGIQ